MLHRRTAGSGSSLDLLASARLHDIRHTLASKLVQKGTTLFEVSKILGHSDVRMSQRSSHLEQKAVAEKSAAILDTLNEQRPSGVRIVVIP